MKNKKLIVFIFLMITAATLLIGFKAFISSSLKFNVTFDKIECFDGSNWQELTSSQTTINVLNSTVTGGNWQNITCNKLPNGTYTLMRLYISAIAFEENGTSRDILSAIKYNSKSNMYPSVVPVIPFTVSGDTSLTMNFFMPSTNIIGTSISNYDVAGPPTIAVRSVASASATSAAGTITATAALSSSLTKFYYGVFNQTPSQTGVAPIFGGALTNTSGTASGNILLPPGNYYICGFEDVDGSGPQDGPSNGDRVYSYGTAGSTPTYTSVEAIAGQTTSISLTYLFDQDPSDSGKNIGQATGEASIKIAYGPMAYSTITLTQEARVFTILSTTSPNDPVVGISPFKVHMSTATAGNLPASTEVTLESLPYGTYYIICIIDVGNDLSMAPTAEDYNGFYGGAFPPASATVSSSNKNLDLTSSPITMTLFVPVP